VQLGDQHHVTFIQPEVEPMQLAPVNEHTDPTAAISYLALCWDNRLPYPECRAFTCTGPQGKPFRPVLTNPSQVGVCLEG
jgi:hypothetical protein